MDSSIYLLLIYILFIVIIFIKCLVILKTYDKAKGKILNCKTRRYKSLFFKKTCDFSYIINNRTYTHKSSFSTFYFSHNNGDYFELLVKPENPTKAYPKHFVLIIKNIITFILIVNLIIFGSAFLMLAMYMN